MPSASFLQASVGDHFHAPNCQSFTFYLLLREVQSLGKGFTRDSETVMYDETVFALGVFCNDFIDSHYYSLRSSVLDFPDRNSLLSYDHPLAFYNSIFDFSTIQVLAAVMTPNEPGLSVAIPPPKRRDSFIATTAHPALATLAADFPAFVPDPFALIRLIHLILPSVSKIPSNVAGSSLCSPVRHLQSFFKLTPRLAATSLWVVTVSLTAASRTAARYRGELHSSNSRAAYS
jgi:hypothetical protein